MFRKRFSRGSRTRAELHERAAPAPVPAVPVEPYEPAPAPTPLKDIVAPRRPGESGLARAPGRTLVVGRDIVLTGEIATCETLVIEGRVKGAVRYVEIEIKRGGRLSGEVDAQAVREVASQPAADPVADPATEAEAAARAPDGSPGSG